MTTSPSDITPDITPVLDRNETLALMEPLLLRDDSPKRSTLADLSLELAQKSAGFRKSLPPSMLTSLAGLVRSMNCYYSNLIEGHDTHPIDIERALKNDYSKDARKRDLQLEAKAHIAVQQWIEQGGVKGRSTTLDAICEIHRRFYDEVPEELRWMDDPVTKERLKIVPGELRLRDVQVGQHIGISPAAVPRFLARFEEVFSRLGKAESVLATAAAHHRLVWIHPFLDGNGRVVRLMSHATLLDTLDTGSVWSIARGLARNVADYKTHLANCDMPRRNDLDGRGSRSEEALAEFTEFFLKTCLDQVTFMEELIQPVRLHARVKLWAEEEMRTGSLPAKSGNLLDALLYRGEVRRGDVGEILGVGDRQGRRVIAALAEKEVLASDSPHAAIRLALPAALASRWMPGLFPDKAA
jgi:Fic family protein